MRRYLRQPQRRSLPGPQPLSRPSANGHDGFARASLPASAPPTTMVRQYVSHNLQTEIRLSRHRQLGRPSVREPEELATARALHSGLQGEPLLQFHRFDDRRGVAPDTSLPSRRDLQPVLIIERHGYRTPAQVWLKTTTALPMAAEAQSGVSELWTATLLHSSSCRPPLIDPGRRKRAFRESGRAPSERSGNGVRSRRTMIALTNSVAGDALPAAAS